MIQGSILCQSAPVSFGRVEYSYGGDNQVFYEALKLRKKELVNEISLITAKLNFSYEEARSLDIETRTMYLDRITEMFESKQQQANNQPLSKKEKEFIQSNQERFGKGKKR